MAVTSLLPRELREAEPEGVAAERDLAGLVGGLVDFGELLELAGFFGFLVDLVVELEAAGERVGFERLVMRRRFFEAMCVWY